MYFIDASEAFYGVIHEKLLTKMFDVYTVWVLAYWFADRSMQVKSATHSL